LLRSSSTRQPSDPPLTVVQVVELSLISLSLVGYDRGETESLLYLTSRASLSEARPPLVLRCRESLTPCVVSDSSSSLSSRSFTLTIVKQTGNDPSAGSPTETLLRLLHPLSNQAWSASAESYESCDPTLSLQSPRLTTQSVIATGGVYKGQGRIHRKLVTCDYKGFLVQG
jgi:hypothetical protein